MHEAVGPLGGARAAARGTPRGLITFPKRAPAKPTFEAAIASAPQECEACHTGRWASGSSQRERADDAGRLLA